MHIRFDRDWLLPGSAILAWLGGTVLAILGIEDDNMLPLMAALLTLLAVFRRWLRQRDRLFVHGYHAGWHAATLDRCTYPEQECDVLEFAATGARRS